MAEGKKRRVLVVGAGSMGIVVGYQLSLGGAAVTYLVRPHRLEALSRPQILYCYDDNTLRKYTGYKLISNPEDILGTNYDYILITLDGASLRNEDGQRLVKKAGKAVRDTTTKIIVGSVFIDLKPWFLDVSGLAPEQVITGALAIHAYPTKSVTLPVHPPTDPELLAQSDLAYIDCLEYALMVDDSSPEVARSFAGLYNTGAPSRCGIKTSQELAVFANSIFAVLAGSQLMDWPAFAEIGTKGELWSLTVAGMREIQSLGIHGEAGQQAAAATTDELAAASLAAWEKQMLPLDLAAFNRFHHGMKTSRQDRGILRACLEYGEREGKPMSAVKELIRRLDGMQRDATK